MSQRMPVGFVGHGSPMNVFNERFAAEMGAWSAAMPKPRALVVVSAHWESRGLRTGTLSTRPLLYDFGGFPAALSQTRYAAPGAPEVEARVHALLAHRWSPSRQGDRPWDHGVWVPLVHLYPAADVPLLQLSLPSDMEPSELIEVGAALAPLRDEGVLLLGSGSLTHNLRRARFDAPVGERDAWAERFDQWIEDHVSAHDFAELARFESHPDAAMSHPTTEHFTPLLVVVGAASPEDAVQYPQTGFELGNLSRRSVRLG